MTSPGTLFRITAGDADKGERLDRFLAQALSRNVTGDAGLPPAALSRSRLKALIEAGSVKSGGATITEPSHRVKPGSAYALEIPPPVEATPRAEAIPLTVVYEDAHLIVVDKPAGLVVHPAPGNPEHTLVNALLAHCGDTLSGIGGVRRPGIVHRLDKDTSGLMVAAKTDIAHEGLARAFAAHTIERRYIAAVWGRIAAKGEVRGAIGRDPRQRKKMAVTARGGKAAATHYQRLKYLGTMASFVACRLETGRTHQVRVHLSHIGHPIVADPLYGRSRARKLSAALRDAVHVFGRQALHAATLGFEHPVTGKVLRFESALPEAFSRLISALEAE